MEYKETNHLLHFILTLFTGFWFLFWIYFGVSNHAHNARVDRLKYEQAMRETIEKELN
jgi:hypothetical protein